MDVEIHIDGKGFKDNLILKNSEALEYAGVILPEGFGYKQDENGNTYASYSGKEYIDIFKPYAYDAKGNEIEVKAILDGRLLRYAIEKASDAEFPITIDPYISYSDVANAMESAFVYSNNPTTNYRNDYLRVGIVSSNEYVSFIRPTTLVGQKSSDTIVSAQLFLKVSKYIPMILLYRHVIDMQVRIQLSICGLKTA